MPLHDKTTSAYYSQEKNITHVTTAGFNFLVKGILVFFLCKYLIAQDNPIYVVKKENIVHSEYDLHY